jgi:hypothetical protein
MLKESYTQGQYTQLKEHWYMFASMCIFVYLLGVLLCLVEEETPKQKF